jgi:tetratricopeptide (TPR) repeat protein
MSMTRFAAHAKLGLTGVALCLLLSAGWSQADEDDSLRKRALAFNDLTGTDPMEKAIKSLLQQRDKTKQLLIVADRMARGKEQPFNYNAAIVMARAAQEVRDIQVAETMYRICVKDAKKLQSAYKLAQSLGGLIEMFYDTKQFAKAVDACREFLELRAQDDDTFNKTVERLQPAIMERMIQAMARQGKIDKALELTERLIAEEDKDTGWYSMQLKAWVLREGNRFEEAVKTYETILDRLNKDQNLKDDIKERFIERNRYYLSGVYVDLKMIDKATEHLQALLKKKPDDPTYNNDLGYIWADNDMNLAEAEKLIRKAIEEDRKERKRIPDLTPEEDKDNAAYLDSLGWVLFKQKKYEEARTYLEKAVEDKEGQHIEIFDHLGDVHMALKDKDKAVAAWRKGVDAAGSSRREQERKALVERKLKDADK